MNIIRCKEGHFYDEDKFNACPHCKNVLSQNDGVTVGMNEEDPVTAPLTVPKNPPAGNPSSLGKEVESIINAPSKPEDEEKTVGFFNTSKVIKTDPVVGWLVCVEGEHCGEDFRLKTGRNFIGRSSSLDVNIAKDNSVSRDKHAIVVYEPKNHLYLIQAGESKELCYLNDRVVLTTAELQINDVIMVGDTKLMFFPCCNAAFNWNMVKKEEGGEAPRL